MLKKIMNYFILLSFIMFILTGCTFNNNDTNSMSSNNTNTDTTNNSKNTDNTDNMNNTNNSNTSENNSYETSKTSYTPTEIDLASFSTPILDKTENRQTNIKITCSKLNSLTIDKGTTFSFCQTVGKSTAEEGYKEADILVNGEKSTALGGGNCQVSTTLYNAILACPGLKVTEHHDHGKKVPYIEKGKDATISYGSLDFKFRNDSENTIKIYASTDGNNVTVRIVKLQ